MMLEVLLYCMVVSLVSSNAWDNVYSQLQADTPIKVENSLNFDIPVPQYKSIVNVDLNSELRLLTVTAYSKIGQFKLMFLKTQLDLETLILSEMAVNSNQCHRYQSCCHSRS